MREISDKTRMAAKKYITQNWRQKYGFLEPFDIDEDKMQETASGIYMKCICHFPNCPTMKNENHPWVSVRGSKLNGRTQISCAACAKKARQLSEYKFEEMQVGDTIGCWHLDEEVNNKEFKRRMGWTGNSKYYKAHCIFCGIEDYKNSDHLKVGDSSCVCRSGSFNEKRINKLLSIILKDNPNYSYMSEYGLNNQRVDFAILDKQNKPVFFIEYDGEFHDNAEMYKGELQDTHKRDEKKNKLAEELNIPILRISYKQQNIISEDWLKKQIEENIGKLV